MNNRGFWRRGWLTQVMAFVILLAGVGSAQAWDINGTVTNNTGRTGRVYLYLQQYGDTGLGVSIPAPALPNTPFKIRGVPNGNYTLKAFVDGSGTGLLHAKDPTWTSSNTININNGDHTVNSNSTVVFNSLPSVTVQPPGNAGIVPGDNGAFVGWDTPQDLNGNYIADSYKVYWSTTSNSPRTNPAGVITVPAGDQTFAAFNFANGTPLYIQVTALVGTTESAATTVASATINPPAAGFSISGTIDLSGISNPTGNLFVALLDMSKDGGGPVAVSHVTSSPQLSNSFTISTNSTNVPNGTYAFIAFLDMNGDNKIGSGDIMIPEHQAPTVTVNGSNIDLGTIAMTRSNSTTFLNTSHWQDTSIPPNDSYQVIVNAESMLETITNITITGGPGTNGLSYPIDLGINSWGQFQAWLNVNDNRPVVAPTPDIYNLSIQYYANGVGPDSVNLPVTAVLDSFATPTAPVGNLPYSAITDPSIYSWTAPASPPTPYTYSFWTSANNFTDNNNQYNQMPSNTSFVSILGLSYNNNQQYNWSINVQDSFGNQAQKSAWFTYTTAPAMNSFTPTTILRGMTLTINGINFSPTPANNTVYFGCGASAQATTASATQLTVVVPQNACSGSIQVNANGQNSSNSSTQLTVLSTISFSGKVTASGSTSSLSGVTVGLLSALLNSTTTSTSDSTTNYTVSDIPAGQDFSISFAKAAYDTAWTGINNSVSDITGRNISLYPAGTLSGWNSGDTTKGAIRGRVQRQSDGTPIAGAIVTAQGRTVMYDGGDGKTPVGGSATSANGVFYILQVPDNATVTINAAAAGFMFNTVTAVSHAGSITNVAVRGLPVVSVSGSIVDSSNAPLAGVTITQVGTSNTATSAADGTFIISNLPGGSGFELMMSLPDYVPNYTGPLYLTNSITLPSPVVLYTTTEFTSTGITAGKGAVIGRVVNSANPVATLSGMQVTTTPSYAVYYFDQTYNSGAGGFSPTATATDASGLFLVANVDDQVGLNLNASNPPANTIYGNTNLTTHANAITQIAVPCNLPIISASGQVTNAITQIGIPNATVAVNSLPITTTTNESGSFNFTSVPYGTDFSLSFSATGYDTAYSATFNVTTYLNVNMAIFPSGSFAAWNGGNTATGVIRGQVFDQNSSNVSGVAISASAGTVLYDDGSGNTPVAGTSTGTNGVFYIKLVPDGTSVTINATKTGYVFGPVTAVGHALGITSVDVPGTFFISIAGTVTNSANAGLTGTTVEQVGTSNSVTSAAGGTFSINNIPGSTNFELKLSLDPTYVPTYSGGLNSMTNITLPFPYVLFTPTEFTTVLGITTGKGAIIGRLVNSANPAVTISGGTVSASGTSPSYVIRYYNSGTGQFNSTTATDASGLFLVRDVEEGAYVSINASAGTYNYNYTNVVTHGNAVSEIAVPCYVPTVDWGNLQSPASITAMTNQPTENIYGQVYMTGVTDMAPGPAPGLVAELGYGPQGTDPASGSWVWKSATYDTQLFNSQFWINVYQYATTLTVPTAGSYDYVYRYSYYGGQYTYGDLNGVVYGISYYPGVLTVNAPPVSVSGFVYTKAGAAVAGATVTVVGSPELTTTTTGDGSYIINGIPLNQNFQVKASMLGYVDAYSATFNTTGSNVNARDLVLLAPDEVNGISSTTGGISGRTIIGGVGTPVAGATVSIVSSSGGPYTVKYDDGTGNFSSTGPTSSNGRFFIPNIADGDTVVLSASRPGWTINGQKSYDVHANAVTQGNLAGAFTTNTVVLLTNGSNFLSLDAAVKASLDTETLLIRDTHFQEELTVDFTLLRPSPTPFTITLKGGLDSDFSTPAATATSVRKLTIKNGKVIANRVVVKPD